jgi:hypothetical protein
MHSNSIKNPRVKCRYPSLFKIQKNVQPLSLRAIFFRKKNDQPPKRREKGLAGLILLQLHKGRHGREREREREKAL